MTGTDNTSDSAKLCKDMHPVTCTQSREDGGSLSNFPSLLTAMCYVSPWTAGKAPQPGGTLPSSDQSISSSQWLLDKILPCFKMYSNHTEPLTLVSSSWVAFRSPFGFESTLDARTVFPTTELLLNRASEAPGIFFGALRPVLHST